MLLFRIINLNVSSTFIYLSYSALIVIYFVFSFITFVFISVSTCTFDIISVVLLLFIFCSMLFFLFIDVLTDNMYGIMDLTALYRTVQHCFIWFILSEAALFISFFWGGIALSVLNSLEFNTLITVLPQAYNYTFTSSGFIFYWVYLDLFNILINTILLFFSGVFCNFFNTTIICKNYIISIMFCMLSLICGFLFMWNQIWEFSLLTFTISTNSFCSSLLSIDLLHFSHVTLGVFFLTIGLIKINNIQLTNMRLIYFVCIILYWHFVDLVWFLLLRFFYFNLLCTFLL